MAPTMFWIGLGNMGRGMCKNIVEKGPIASPLLVHNRTLQRAKDLSSSLPSGKTAVIEDIAEGVRKADVIFTCIGDDKAIEATLATILSGGADLKDKLFIDSSTIHPETTEKAAAQIIARGGKFVAAPVFGAPAKADSGELVAVLAGPSASVDLARPYFLHVTSKHEILLKDKPYSAALNLKILGNTLVMGMVTGLAEANVAAEKLGLGGDAMLEVVTQLFGGPYADYTKRMQNGVYWQKEEPLFDAELARKDIRHAKNLVEGVGAKVSILDSADSYLKKTAEYEATKGRKGDIAGIYGAARLEAGLKFETE